LLQSLYLICVKVKPLQTIRLCSAVIEADVCGHNIDTHEQTEFQ
jgi:hypothetical protein